MMGQKVFIAILMLTILRCKEFYMYGEKNTMRTIALPSDQNIQKVQTKQLHDIMYMKYLYGSNSQDSKLVKYKLVDGKW